MGSLGCPQTWTALGARVAAVRSAAYPGSLLESLDHSQELPDYQIYGVLLAGQLRLEILQNAHYLRWKKQKRTKTWAHNLSKACGSGSIGGIVQIPVLATEEERQHGGLQTN